VANTAQTLLGKDWIEERGVGYDQCYRITEKGIAAKIMPVPVYK
jgi:hypothetical protein